MSIEQALQLNNEIVVPAKRIREYQSNSLAKNNSLVKIDVSNKDFLKVSRKIQPYYFAEAKNIAGEEGADYKNIYTESTNKAWTGSTGYNDSTTETVITAEQSKNAEYIYVSARFRFYGNEQLDPIIGVTESVDIIIDQKMKDGAQINKHRTVEGGIGATERATAITLSLRYSNGVLYAEQTKETFGNYGREPLLGEILIQEVLLDNRANDENLIFGANNTYTVGETNFGLLDDNEIFVVDGTSLSNISAKGSALLDDGESDEANFDVYIMPRTYTSFVDFRNDCKNFFAQNPTQYAAIGILDKNKKTAINENCFRFGKNFTVYTCNATSTPNLTNWTNFEISLKVPKGTAYYIQELAYSLGEATSDSNQFIVQGNSLLQEETLTGNVSSYKDLADKTLKRFKNGRNTTKVSVFYDKYLDSKGGLVYNGVDGYFPKVDDIITPYTIRTKSGADLPIEVPLYTENYITNQDGSQSAVGKQFYVTSCSLEYDGDFRVELEAIEKTD